MARKLHLLQREMNSFAMDKFRKAKKPNLSRPKNIMPYMPSGGIKLPSPRGGYPYAKEQIDAYMKAAREQGEAWRNSLVNAFVALKGLADAT